MPAFSTRMDREWKSDFLATDFQNYWGRLSFGERPPLSCELTPKPGDPVYGAPDAMLSLVPRESGARPVAVVEAFDPETGRITLRGFAPPSPPAPQPLRARGSRD